MRLSPILLAVALLAPIAPVFAQERGLSIQEVSTMRQAGVHITLPGEPPQGHEIPANIALADLIRAELLDFSGKPLTRLPAWLNKFTGVRHLNLAATGVRIGGLDPVRAMPQLEVLDLSGNPLFDKGGGGAESNALWAALPNLRILNLARTGGEAGQYGDLGRLRNLHRLDLSGNRINNLGPLNLAGLNGLQRLALADNPLGNLDPAQLPLASVQSLDLSRAGLTLLRFKEDLPNLKELLLSGNRGLKLDEEYGDLFVLQALAAAEFDSDAQMPKGLKERLQRLQEQADRARRAGLKEAQQAAARAAGRGVEYQDAFLDGSRQGPVMVVIPGGEFQMGCSPGDGACSSSEGPPHRVRVKPFAIGKYEVSQAEWEAVMGDNPATFKAPDNPVGSVGWDDAQSFIAKLNQRTGKKYRLPTEAEWEYAARAATTTPYWWGSQASHDHANYGEDKCCGGYKSGKDQWENTAPVNSMAANPLGLHHILGNVWEWVQDCWHDNYQGAPTEAREWHENCRNADHRVFRGGSWLYYPSGLRSSNRSGNAASFRLNLDIGFRLAQDL